MTGPIESGYSRSSKKTAQPIHAHDRFGSPLMPSLSPFGTVQRIAAPKQMSKSAPTRDKRTTTIRERKTKRPGWLLLMPSF